MMRVRHSGFGISAVARLASKLERNDARDVALEREHLQIEHKSRMIDVSSRRAHGPVQVRQRIVRDAGLRLLNSPLDFANAIEIVADLLTIGRAKLPIQARDVVLDEVEETGAFSQCRLALGFAAAL